ncbi:MAG: hypothetical protein JWM33_3309 [Caulobacteraceae bacterium]|nr:hypothetical protein [Caulobacteraceae bacterium]
MIPEILPILAAVGIVIGGAAAQLSAPLSCRWPSSGDELMLRMKALGRPETGKGRMLLGGALIAALIGGGTLSAYAAAPSAPQVALPADLSSLPGQVIGVVGSGDQLSLQIRASDRQGPRTVRPGDEYQNGWTLRAVTPTLAILSRAGETHQVGLNPAGTLAAPAAAAPSSVTVQLSAQDKADLEAMIAAGNWDGKAMPGLTLAESQSHVLMVSRIEALSPPSLPGSRRLLTMVQDAPMRARFGDAAVDQFRVESQRMIQATTDMAWADLAARPLTGPSTYYIPPGVSESAAMAQAGVDPRGDWGFGVRDANGGTTYTRQNPVAQVLPGLQLPYDRAVIITPSNPGRGGAAPPISQAGAP